MISGGKALLELDIVGSFWNKTEEEEAIKGLIKRHFIYTVEVCKIRFASVAVPGDPRYTLRNLVSALFICRLYIY